MTLPVSIIIPVYIKDEQSAIWLEECIDSAIQQDCEIVLWNDGSPYIYDLWKYLDAKAYTHFNIFADGSKENHGVAYARNRATELATQPFIFPLDCDDLLVPGAIKKMLDAWNGNPIYPDVEKFGEIVVPHFRLLEFSCEALLKYVGAFPTSVLQLKEQWSSIGGWDESIDFYEDGEYNARLMANYCGQRYPEPLLRYRFHSSQRTKRYNNVAGKYTKDLLPKIRSYVMAKTCCGGSRRLSFGNTTTKSATGFEQVTVSDVSVQVEFLSGELNVPLEADGKVLARYTGGFGKGKHVHNGNVTGKPYSRIVFGDLVYVDPRDAKDTDTGENPKSFFVKIKVANPKVVARATKEELTREPVTTEGVLREPVAILDSEGNEIELEAEIFEEEEEVDISELTLKEVKKYIITAEDAKYWLPIEQAGKNRDGVVKHLQGIISNE